MKLLERVYYSIKGKRVKSLLLLLTVTLLATFLSASFSIYQANQSLEKKIKENLNPIVVIDWGYSQYEYENLSKENKREEIVNQYRSDERIKLYESRYTLMTNLSCFYIWPALEDEINGEINLGYSQSVTLYKNDEPIDVVKIYNTIHFLGIDHHSISDIEVGNAKLMEGRTFTEEEIEDGEDVFIYLFGFEPVSFFVDNFKSNQNFGISIRNGYYISSFPVSDKTTTYVEDINYFKKINLIGIAECSEYTPLQVKYHAKEAYIAYHTYMPVKSLKKIGEDFREILDEMVMIYPWIKEDENYDNFGSTFLVDTFIELNSYDDLDAFVDEIEKECKGLIRGVYSYSNSYQDVQNIVMNLNVIAIISFVVCAIASIVLLSLIVSLLIHERRYEIGVYLSLGESRKRVMSQILLEILLIGMLGITISLFTGNQIANVLSNDLLERVMKQQIQVSEENQDYEISEEEILDTYDVQITVDYVICVYAGGMVVLLLSCIYPMKGIMKMKVKKMLM